MGRKLSVKGGKGRVRITGELELTFMVNRGRRAIFGTSKTERPLATDKRLDKIVNLHLVPRVHEDQK